MTVYCNGRKALYTLNSLLGRNWGLVLFGFNFENANILYLSPQMAPNHIVDLNGTGNSIPAWQEQS